MAFAGNLFWFVFGGGLFAWLGWMLIGLLLCCTIIGIPFGIASFRIAGFAAFPFGKELVDARELNEKRIAGTGLANFLWILFAGFWLACGHVLAGISCFILFPLVIPIFFGIVHFKLASDCFAPLGKRAVKKEIAEEAKRRSAKNFLDNKFAGAKTTQPTPAVTQ